MRRVWWKTTTNSGALSAINVNRGSGRTGHHSQEGEAVHQHPQQSRGNEALNGVDVTRQTADQIAGLFPIVETQREPLYVRVQRVAQVVHHPLS